MTLIKCPECNNEISNTTKKCIHCGYKFKKNSIIAYFMPLIIIVSVFLVGLYIVSGLLNKHSFGLAINDKYGEKVEYRCGNYMKKAGDDSKNLYECSVKEEYRTKNICLECTNSSFLLFSHVSDCKVKLESSCVFYKIGLYN